MLNIIKKIVMFDNFKIKASSGLLMKDFIPIEVDPAKYNDYTVVVNSTGLFIITIKFSTYIDGLLLETKTVVIDRSTPYDTFVAHTEKVNFQFDEFVTTVDTDVTVNPITDSVITAKLLYSNEQ
jgi:hypothetical protein